MRLCPICDNKADSKHHIIPRAEGGLDEDRNIIWLCRKCHDENEGEVFTPKLLQKLRQEVKGAQATSNEEYWYLIKEEGVFFLGIQKPNKDIIHYGILFPYESQFTFLKTKDLNIQPIQAFKAKIKRGRGRPVCIIPEENRQILEGNMPIREKAELLGVSKSTVANLSKKLCEGKVVYSS